VGRKEVRDIIVEERRAGRTILFSTHILSDVETLCDRVTILRKGEAVVSGSLDQLLRREIKLTDICLAGMSDEQFARLIELDVTAERQGLHVIVRVEGSVRLQEVLASLLAKGFEVLEVSSRQETLEDLFVREAI
jgi:ABC-2 type transport system ATP-binding protein